MAASYLKTFRMVAYRSWPARFARTVRTAAGAGGRDPDRRGGTQVDRRIITGKAAGVGGVAWAAVRSRSCSSKPGSSQPFITAVSFQPRLNRGVVAKAARWRASLACVVSARSQRRVRDAGIAGKSFLYLIFGTPNVLTSLDAYRPQAQNIVGIRGLITLEVNSCVRGFF